MNYMGGLELIIAGLLYSIFGLRDPDDGTVVTFYRDIKLNLGFGVVHRC